MANPIQMVKDFLRQTLFSIYQRRLYREWGKRGKPVPPPHLVKQMTLKEYAKKFNLHIFVETGTYRGDMVNAVKDVFDEIFSIELGPELCQKARKRFADAKHVTILLGDSGEALKDVLTQITKPCLFWLDGHYSAGITARGNKETPVEQELAHIFNHPMAHDHVILIDDAQYFTGQGDYPGIQPLKELAKSAGFDGFEVKDDMIRIWKMR